LFLSRNASLETLLDKTVDFIQRGAQSKDSLQIDAATLAQGGFHGQRADQRVNAIGQQCQHGADALWTLGLVAAAYSLVEEGHHLAKRVDWGQRHTFHL